MITTSQSQWSSSERFEAMIRQSSLDADPVGDVNFHLEMLRGCFRVGSRVRHCFGQSDELEISQLNGYMLILCVERFFKNPQENYEVPLNLLQEWFSEINLGRREELAKLFLLHLREQGLDMSRILAPAAECIDNNKTKFYLDDDSSPYYSDYSVEEEEEPAPPSPVPVKSTKDRFEEIEAIRRQWADDSNLTSPEPSPPPSRVSNCPSPSVDLKSKSDNIEIKQNEMKSPENGLSAALRAERNKKLLGEPKKLLKCQSLVNITEMAEKQQLKRCQSLPSIKFDIKDSPPEIPPLAPIEPQPKKVEHVPIYKQSVINRASSKPLKKRVIPIPHEGLLPVDFKPGFRIGGQILYVPDLVSCSTPETAPALLVTEPKQTRKPVEVKLAVMNNEMAENVVVSQNSSSHTIHYTPTRTQATPAASAMSEKSCSVVYVTETASPVLVAPGSTWQEEARKKPIIAYAKRKPPEKVDNKALVTPNGVTNQAEVQPTKVITQCKTEAIKHPVITYPQSGPSEDLSYLKKPEEKRAPVLVIPPETPSNTAQPKPTLPKFNQTFVQNLQVKTAKAAEPIADAQNLDYIRKDPEVPVETPPVPEINTVLRTSTVLHENVAHMTNHTPGVIHSIPAAPTPVVVERPVIKQVQNPPQQVGLLIYTQNANEESSPIQTLLLTTLPNGSAYCVRLPTNTNLHSLSSAAVTTHVEPPKRPIVLQTLGTPVTVKTVVRKPEEAIPPTPPPAESNKVALLQDLKEFENVFEETKLKFEKEKQQNVESTPSEIPPAPLSVETAVQTTPIPPEDSPSLVPLTKFDCEKVVVGVKRKADEIPVVTRLYTAAKKPLIVLANYGQPSPEQVSPQPVVTQVCNPSPTGSTGKAPPKPKSRPTKTSPNPSKSPPVAKPMQKPHEDEKTQQKIFAILEEYAVQKEHSPDTNNRPAPRRRTNPPVGPGLKKKPKSLLKTKENGEGDSEDGNVSEITSEQSDSA